MKQKDREKCKHQWGKPQSISSHDKEYLLRTPKLSLLVEHVIEFLFIQKHYQKCKKCGILRLVE